MRFLKNGAEVAKGYYLIHILEVFPDEVQKREQLGQNYSEWLAHLDGLETQVSESLASLSMHSMRSFLFTEKRFKNLSKIKGLTSLDLASSGKTKEGAVLAKVSV